MTAAAMMATKDTPLQIIGFQADEPGPSQSPTMRKIQAVVVNERLMEDDKKQTAAEKKHGRVRSLLGTWGKHTTVRLRLPFRSRQRTPVQDLFAGPIAASGADEE